MARDDAWCVTPGENASVSVSSNRNTDRPLQKENTVIFILSKGKRRNQIGRLWLISLKVNASRCSRALRCRLQLQLGSGAGFGRSKIETGDEDRAACRQCRITSRNGIRWHIRASFAADEKRRNLKFEISPTSTVYDRVNKWFRGSRCVLRSVLHSPLPISNSRSTKRSKIINVPESIGDLFHFPRMNFLTHTFLSLLHSDYKINNILCNHDNIISLPFDLCTNK